jgi:hypothetical protein
MFQELITLKFYQVVLLHVNQFIHAKHTCTTHKTKGMLAKNYIWTNKMRFNISINCFTY